MLSCFVSFFSFATSFVACVEIFCVHGAPRYTSKWSRLVSFCCRHVISFSFGGFTREHGASPDPHCLHSTSGSLSSYSFLCWTDSSTFLLLALTIRGWILLRPDTPGALCSYEQPTAHCHRDSGTVHVHQHAAFLAQQRHLQPDSNPHRWCWLAKTSLVLCSPLSPFVFYDWLATVVVVFIVGNPLIPNWNCDSAIPLCICYMKKKWFGSKPEFSRPLGFLSVTWECFFFACTT